jgi:hypothetical protein
MAKTPLVPPGTYTDTTYQSQPLRVANPPLDFQADVTVEPESFLEVDIFFGTSRSSLSQIGRFSCSDPHSIVRFIAQTRGWVQITAVVTGTITLNSLTITT